MSRDSVFLQNQGVGKSLLDTALTESEYLTQGTISPRLNSENIRQNPFSRSGNEASRLFLNSKGIRFSDISGLSGLSSREDGRALAYWDYNRDGFYDIATANASDPLLENFKNNRINLGGRISRYVAIRLVGGNTSPLSSIQYSNRDGVGAKIKIFTENMKGISRELRFGEGLAAQNSSTIVVGIGKNESAKIKVLWPSRITQEIDNVNAGSLVTVYENEQHSPSGTLYSVSPYAIE